MSATTSCDIVSFTVQSTRVLGIAECVGSCGYAADRRFYSEPLRKDVTLAEKKAHGFPVVKFQLYVLILSFPDMLLIAPERPSKYYLTIAT
uniref:Uncharacterized protein n=1 Tax=Vespula pensylvanica TaxID=30213 RepID=A0A834P1U2_VESPE|nr:hypothetical protein H0235_007769 [Vespula pensylvanica]